MASPAPKSPDQTEKSRKYDRQLRLWGDHGQKVLENAKVCLINASALGTEILKSLVLSGIGFFTIVDGQKVTEEDVGNNFFVDVESIGASRAQVATQNLLELNPDVRGDYIDESVDHIMSHSQDFFDNFTLIIATNFSEKILMALSRHLWEKNVPMLACRSIGFLGYIRLQFREHTIIEAHPDSENPDLRLENPWPALEQYLSTIEIANLDSKERSHVPALTILYYYLKKYQESHDGNLPKTREEKAELRQLIESSALLDDGGFKQLEENFKEAIKYGNTALNQVRIPLQISVLINDEACINLSDKSKPFWILCAALREFIETEGALPLRGSLPDMASDTNSYVTLQQLYQKQAHNHTEIIHRRAQQIATNLGLCSEIITESDAKLFCRHASELFVVRGSSLAEEIHKNSLDLGLYLEDSDGLMFYYIVLRGLERFLSEFNIYPGQLDDHVEPDVVKMKGIIGKLLNEWGCSQIGRDERVHDICRYGGAELHSVSAILGGCAAHEAIKLVTGQYKLLNNTFVYDAMTSNSATFTL